MIKDHLKELLVKYLEHPPTPSQKELINGLGDVIAQPATDDLYLIKGYAGTGKTTIVRAIVKTLEEMETKSILLAPTGRAAKVLSHYSGKSAYTIHKKIYRQKSMQETFSEFQLDANLHSNTFFIVDEASMISNQSGDISIFGSGKLLDDLIKYVYNDKNCTLILLGDTAQLPPVGIDISPALDPKVLEGYGLNVHMTELTEVIRQQMHSGILYNATAIRDQIAREKDYTPRFSIGDYADIERVTGEFLVETLSDSLDQDDPGNTIVITRSNKRANAYNQGIRNQILFRENEISPGDYLMVVKNNYFWLPQYEELPVDFIANGDIVELVSIIDYEEQHGYRFADVVIRLADYGEVEVEAKLMLDTLYIDRASLSTEQNKNLFYSIMEDYAEIKNKKERIGQIREDPYFNALQVKFAYAVTCHKAQGGQWRNVFVDQGYLRDDMINREYLRWLYTAFTRATDKLFLVNFNDSFFSDS